MDGPSVCTDSPTFAESIRLHGEEQLPSVLLFGTIFFIPIFIKPVVRSRIWSVIVAGAILIGLVAGFVIGPLIVQYRYPELYWSNPDLLGETIDSAIGTIILSFPFSTLVPRVFFGQSGEEKSSQVRANAAHG